VLIEQQERNMEKNKNLINIIEIEKQLNFIIENSDCRGIQPELIFGCYLSLKINNYSICEKCKHYLKCKECISCYEIKENKKNGKNL
jgi:hypothetical protein